MVIRPLERSVHTWPWAPTAVDWDEIRILFWDSSMFKSSYISCVNHCGDIGLQSMKPKYSRNTVNGCNVRT